jgi:hypothetical protein
MSAASWRDAQSELEALRKAYDPQAGTMRVAVQFSAGADVLGMKGRGAIARRPPEDLRMILLGPGGMTAFDLLLRRDHFRLEIPSKQRVWRGDSTTSPEELRGLPVSFLRWWLLRPLSGRLLSVHEAPGGKVFVLREEDGTVRVQQRAEGLRMDRRSPSGTERMQVSGPGCADAHYEHVEGKVRVRVRCEALVGGAEGLEERMFE